VSAAGGKHKSILRGLNIGCEAIQIFVKSNRSWRAGALTEADVKKFKETRMEHTEKIRSIMCHGTYLVNLAAENEEVLNKSIECFKVELDYSTRLELDYLVFHPGSPKSIGLNKGIEQIASSLNEIIKSFPKSRVLILLENTAGQGTMIGRKFSELRKILDKIEEQKRVGICFDTCHAFAAGYDITEEKGYEKTFNEIDDEIGLDRLYAFHINDSKYDLATNRDRHAHIGEGFIGTEGFRLLINDDRFRDHPATLETPDPELFPRDLERLRALIN